MKRLKDTLMAVLDLIIPPACLACHQRLSSRQTYLCPDCESKIEVAHQVGCPKCGGKTEAGFCTHCRDINYSFEFARSALQYKTPLPDLIHSFKYKEMRSIGNFLADRMAKAAKDYPPFEEYTDVVAIPLHPVRKRERGYNQSEIIARRLARKLGKNYLDCISRARYTKSQTNLERKDRFKNLSNAFIVKKASQVKGKSLILVDDVFTTGSTMNEASRALYSAGAAKVAGFTATRA